jgi:hypothetical protein
MLPTLYSRRESLIQLCAQIDEIRCCYFSLPSGA